MEPAFSGKGEMLCQVLLVIKINSHETSTEPKSLN